MILNHKTIVIILHGFSKHLSSKKRLVRCKSLGMLATKLKAYDYQN